MHRISTQILLMLTIFSGVAALCIDSFMYLVQLDVSLVALSLENLREIIIIIFIISYAYLMKRRFLLEHLTLPQKLIRLAFLVIVLFVSGLLLNVSLNPEYTRGSTLQYSNVHGMLQANIVGLLTIVALVPIIFLTRELIFYKQKRTTRLYFNIFITLLVISAIYGSIADKILELSFTTEDIYNFILVISLGLITILLAMRNDWITYLSRRDKIIYFFLGVLVVVMIERMREVVFGVHLKAYSYIAVNFGYITYYFLTLYGIIAMFTLLVHLPAARAVDRKLREVNSLYDFSRMLNSELNHQKLTQLITQLTATVLESQSTWLEEYNAPKRKLKIVSQIHLTQQQILNNPFIALTGFNHQVISGKKPILVNDTAQHPELRQISQWKKDARALIAAPLYSSRDQLMGIIYATKSQPYGFDIDDVSLLEAFANQSVIALENAELWQSSLEKERLEQELRVAREVQLKLVPQVMPVVEGVEIDSYFLTAYEVGGDYYDFIQFSDGYPGVVIGDVSGKGTSAAFYMAEFKGVIQTLAQTQAGPRDLICHANKIFYTTIERQSFVTAIVGKLIPEESRFTFVRAGHTPVLYCPADGESARYLQPAGLGIGLDRGEIFEDIVEEASMIVKRGDILLLFTDGLIELRDRDGNEFGEERLLEIMGSCRNQNASSIKEVLLDELMGFIGDTPLHDDLTMIILKF